MKVFKSTWIIHAFALMHAIVSMACHFWGIADDVMLTLLTMLLVIIICLSRKVGLLYMAIAVVLVNILGFALGMGFAALFKWMSIPDFAAHTLATFLCTEIIGWGTEGMASVYLKKNQSKAQVDAKSLRWLLFAFVVIIILRLSIILIDSPAAKDTAFFFELLLDYMFSCLAIVVVAEYAIRSRLKAEQAREDADLAKFRYLKLKQQLDPHFLFNSLNVLDYMIQEQSTEQASEFTHKLAELYRYMLKYEGYTTVNLKEELSLLENYVSLLKTRFNDGLKVEINIEDKYLYRHVVPCCLQLLTENAVKHNAVQEGHPLVVRIFIDNDALTVSNNRNRKISSTNSTGLGLKYLRQQYSDIADKDISVIDAKEQYTVILPLL